MIVNSVFRSRILVSCVLAAFVLLVTPVAQFAQVKAPAPAANGSLVGFIYEKDMRTPVQNAVVKLRNLANSDEYESTPSDATGMYRIVGIEEGRYVLGVTATKGDFNFDYALVLKGNEVAKLSVALTPADQTSWSNDNAKPTSYFTSPAGIMTLVIVVGAVLYGLLKGKEETSPIR
jgi:hypothetical protein